MIKRNKYIQKNMKHFLKQGCKIISILLHIKIPNVFKGPVVEECIDKTIKLTYEKYFLK